MWVCGVVLVMIAVMTQQLMINYATNVAFYLLLKVKCESRFSRTVACFT
jgi:hypothetical protein